MPTLRQESWGNQFVLYTWSKHETHFFSPQMHFQTLLFTIGHIKGSFQTEEVSIHDRGGARSTISVSPDDHERLAQ